MPRYNTSTRLFRGPKGNRPGALAGRHDPRRHGNSLNRPGGIYAQLDGLDAQITGLRNQRDAAAGDLWGRMGDAFVPPGRQLRLARGTPSCFGGSSPEYEVVGGTCIGDRFRPARKTSSFPWGNNFVTPGKRLRYTGETL